MPVTDTALSIRFGPALAKRDRSDISGDYQRVGDFTTELDQFKLTFPIIRMPQFMLRNDERETRTH